MISLTLFLFFFFFLSLATSQECSCNVPFCSCFGGPCPLPVPRTDAAGACLAKNLPSFSFNCLGSSATLAGELQLQVQSNLTAAVVWVFDNEEDFLRFQNCSAPTPFSSFRFANNSCTGLVRVGLPNRRGYAAIECLDDDSDCALRFGFLATCRMIVGNGAIVFGSICSALGAGLFVATVVVGVKFWEQRGSRLSAAVIGGTGLCSIFVASFFATFTSMAASPEGDFLMFSSSLQPQALRYTDHVVALVKTCYWLDRFMTFSCTMSFWWVLHDLVIPFYPERERGILIFFAVLSLAFGCVGIAVSVPKMADFFGFHAWTTAVYYCAFGLLSLITVIAFVVLSVKLGREENVDRTSLRRLILLTSSLVFFNLLRGGFALYFWSVNGKHYFRGLGDNRVDFPGMFRAIQFNSVSEGYLFYTFVQFMPNVVPQVFLLGMYAHTKRKAQELSYVPLTDKVPPRYSDF